MTDNQFGVADSDQVYCKDMDKRLAKRHKRQVAREREKVKVSEPDVRTHEQIEAARKKTRPEFNANGTPKQPES